MPTILGNLRGASNETVLEQEFPNLKPDALFSLTEKIQHDLKKSPNEKLRKVPAIRPSKGSNSKNEIIQTTKRPTKPAEGLKSIERRKNGKAEVIEERTHPVPNPRNGEKRLQNGIPKVSSNTKSEYSSIAMGMKGNKTHKESFDIEQEILALGGTKDDYELIAEALSDSEMEAEDLDQAKVSRSDLQKDLARLVREIGIEKAQVEVEDEDRTSELKSKFTIGEYNTASLEIPTPNVGSGEKPSILPTRTAAKSSSHLYFEPQSEWHAATLPTLPTLSHDQSALSQDLSNRVHQFARTLLEKENTHYGSRNGGSLPSAQQFYSTIMSSGTLSDKISALTLSVQESPVHNVKALENLVGLARKRSRGQAVEVLGALKDLFGPGALLPADRKLRVFALQPGLIAAFCNVEKDWDSNDPLPSPLQEAHLITWAYEDWLKSTYFEILKIIETWCNDEVVFARVKAVDYVCQLLKEKPEQEANLLRLLVNKLGDSDKKIASRTSYSILQLENTHPLMKPTIIASIESDLLFRPGQSLHAQYYAIITLNQTVLSSKEDGVARKLLDIYFSLFIMLLERPEATTPGTSGANSVTINRKGELQKGGSAPGKKALKKQASLQKSANVGEDLREKMLSAVLTGVNRAIPFMPADDESFEKHMDTLFRVTHSSNFNTSIQALMLIQQLSGSTRGSADRFYRTLYESLLDPRLLTSSKQALYLNLLFRSVRADLNVKRVKAFAKRLLQVVTMHQPAFACGALYLLRELESIFTNLQTFIDQAEEGESDEEETFHDVQEDGDDHVAPTEARTEILKPARNPISRSYDGRKRDPEYSNAENSCLWELTPFLMHFHPSVALFASKLLRHETMPPKPDLSSHTLIHFLDRFVYKNAKTTGGPRGNSVMQPMAGGDASSILISARSTNALGDPVNSEHFRRTEGGKVNADEVFFHKYFSTTGKGKDRASKKKSERKAGPVNDSEADENEDEIWKALVDSRPELEGSDDSDGDMEDLDSAMEDDDDEDDTGSLAGKDEADDSESDEDAEVDTEAMDLGNDDEALLGSDDDAPSDLDQAFKDEMQFGKAQASSEAPEEKRGKKRRRIKNLPTFASADDYAKMLGDDNEEEDGLAFR